LGPIVGLLSERIGIGAVIVGCPEPPPEMA
jgi:hypothetical protein